MHPAVAAALVSAFVPDHRPVGAQREVGAVRDADAEPGGSDVLALDLAGRGVDAIDAAPVDESQRARARAARCRSCRRSRACRPRRCRDSPQSLVTSRSRKPRTESAPPMPNCSPVTSMSSVYWPFIARRACQSPRQRAVVVEGPAPDRVVRAGALADAVAARGAEVASSPSLPPGMFFDKPTWKPVSLSCCR